MDRLMTRSAIMASLIFQPVFFFMCGTAVATKNSDFTLDQAFACIQLNKDLQLASQQMLQTENSKAHISSKISYLDGAIQERRDLIEKLDQTPSQDNNENYNQLVTQYENLVEERRDDIGKYQQIHQLHITQHESVIRLEQRFSQTCLTDIVISEEIYTQACQQQQVRWCTVFNF